MNPNKYLENIRSLIASDDLSKAIQLLSQLFKSSPKLDEAILQSARFQDIRKQIRLGTVSHEEANLTKNKIRAGILDLLQELEQQSEKAVIREELEVATKTIIQKADKIYNIDKIDNANFS